MAKLPKITYKGTEYDVYDDKALHQDDIGPWMPDFDNMPVLETHEFDISGTSIYKVCERANVTSINDATDVIAYRCTVTGTNIRSVTDVIFRLTPTVNTAPNVTAYNRTLSTTAATTGLRYIYTVYPKAANTNYTYQSCVAMYNSTTRHVKIEVFKTNSNWTFVNARTSYSYNSTYQTRNELSIYTRLGYISNSTAYFNANTATSATYISSYAPLYNSSYSLLTAGAALSANTIAFVSSEDNKVYPISNTTKAINTNWPLMWVSNAVSSGGAISYSYLRVFGTITPGSTVTKDTFAAGQTVYCRCTLSNGNVYSNNLLTPTITPGYAYVKFGIAYSATVVVENTYGAFYFYKDMNGNVSNLNGYPIGAERANSVAKNINASAGSYGVLIDDHDISTLNSTVVPSISNNLTFNPSTGILNATGFSGSGAGLTNIQSSGINYDELPLITDYTGPSGNGRFVTFLQNESDDPYTHPYLLEAPDAMTYRVGTNSIAFTNGVGLRRYKLGVYGARYSNTNDVSTFWCAHLKTPIEVDPSTHMPTNSLIVDGAKMTFRFYGDVTYADASSDYFDTYFTLCYQNQNGSGNWSVYYETRGDIHYGASITYHENHVAIVIGWAYNESTYNKQLQNFKAYRYVDMTLDHLGSTLGYAGGTSNYCKLIENRSGWTGLCWQGNASESWSDVLSQVYSNGRIEGTRGYSQDGELLPTKTLHVYHDIDLDTYEFTDSLTAQEIKDILDDAADGTINLQISMVDADTSKLLKYYQTGNMFVAKYLVFEDTPAIDMTTYQNHSLQSYFAIVWSAGSDTFQFMPVPGDDLSTLSQQLMQLLAAKEDLSNKVTSISSSSTDDEYPSAKCVYDAISGISPSGGAGDDCYYGYCSAAATASKKVVSISNSGYTITDHVRLFVYFANAHTYSSSKPYLSIDDVTYQIRYYDLSISAEESTSMINNILYNRRYMEFYFMTMSGSLTAIALPDAIPTLFSPYRTNNTRITNLNNFSTANGAYMKYVIASSNTVTTGKPKINGADASALVLHMNWDNSNAYAGQLALQVGGTTEQGGMAYRRQNGTASGWHDWKTIADEDNIGTLTDVEHCYTAALTPAGDGTIVFPIDGTKYKVTQITLTNFDLNATAGFGMSRIFVANNGGSGGYMLQSTDYFSLTSTSTDITMSIASSSSSGMQNSTNLHVQVRYVKL